VLQLEAVSVGYGGAVVNRSVSLDVSQGEILSLIGRNGWESPHWPRVSLA
jgi:ABC-type branched-subunit amino acid transport system ATPase component